MQTQAGLLRQNDPRPAVSAVLCTGAMSKWGLFSHHAHFTASNVAPLPPLPPLPFSLFPAGGVFVVHSACLFCLSFACHRLPDLPVPQERIVISPQMVPISQLTLLAIRALQKLEDAAA